MMQIISITSGVFGTNSYIVFDEKTKDALIIDAPPSSASKIIDAVIKNGLIVKHLVNTHGHIDHANDNEIIKKELKIKLLIHKDDEIWLNPPEPFLIFFPIEHKPSFANSFLSEGDVLEVGNLKFTVIHTPGHTIGSICLYEPNQKVLFSGDTLFFETIGRSDLPGGSSELILNSIKNKILTLPDEVVVYPGHGENTNIKHEKEFNSYI